MKNKRILTLAITILICALGYSLPKPSMTLRLYPDGQTGKTGIALGPGESNMITEPMEEIHEHVYQYVTDPFINIYLPKKCNGQMIVICPGGGYRNVWSYHEGAKMAAWALERGIAACVVVYRLPNGHHKVPLTDVQNAIRYCRANAKSWGVRQIGVAGFSAGGHLAASASTLFVDADTRPDFSILIYPVISFTEISHGGTKKNLIGANPSQELIDHYSLEKRVSPSTPPAFIALSQDDKVVDPNNSIMYYQALLRNSVPGELHIYTKGGHGWGFGSRFETEEDILEEQRVDFDAALERWLKYIEQ